MHNAITEHLKSKPANSPAKASAHGASLSVKDITSALLRWWWQCLLCGVVLASASCAVVLLSFEPRYDGRALLKIQDRSPYVVFEPKGSSSVFAQTELETIRSPYVLSKVAAEPEIAGLSEAREALAKYKTLMDWLVKGLKVTYVGRSELCEIHFIAHDPETAAKVANSVMDAYLSLQRDALGEQTERVIELLMEEQRNRKAELKQLQDRVRIITKKATGQEPVFLAGSHDVHVQQNPLAMAEERLAASEVDRAVAEAKLRALEEESAGENVEVPAGAFARAIESHPELQRLLEELRDAKAKLREYHGKKAESATANRLMTGLKSQIARLEQSVKQAREQMTPDVKRELEAVMVAQRKGDIDELREQIREQKLVEETWKKRLAEQRAKYEKLGDESVDLEFARNELQLAEEVYRKIADRVVVLRTERRAPARAETLVRATPPPLPLEKLPFKLFGVATLLSFGLPVGLAILFEHRLRRISDSEQVSTETNLAVLGEIAALPARLALTEDTGDDRSLRARLAFEESVDSLRTSLTLSPQLKHCQVLTVTSAVSREGKTSLASSLAVSLARHFREGVLLIDADLRAPDLQHVFDVPLSPGLAEVLNGECDVHEAIVKSSSSVHLLPAGKLVGSPHAIVRHGGLVSLIEKVRADYRYIVVDAPPVLAASEALTIAAAADATLVCAMRELTRARQMRMACDRLANAGANLVGAVFSGVPLRSWGHRYGYYGYDRYATVTDTNANDIA